MKQFDLNIDNTTLVEECKAGDREAMSLLYTRFAPRMLHVITRYVNNKEDAHDILHDGFIAAFTRLDTLRDPERIDYWLASIMKNLSLKFLQSQNVESILDEIPEELEEDSDIEDIIDFNTLETLIMQLPDGYQKVFRLAVLENKSHKEISKILGIAPNSSSSQLFHAKVMLRRLIIEHRKRAGLMTLLLLIAVSTGLLILTRNDLVDNNDPQLLSQADAIDEAISDVATGCSSDHKEDEDPIESHKLGGSSIVKAKTRSSKGLPSSLTVVIPATNDSTTIMQESIQEEEEVHIVKPSDIANSNNNMMAESLYGKTVDEIGLPGKKSSGKKRWSVGVTFDSGIISFDGISSSSDKANSCENPALPPHNPDDPQTEPEGENQKTPMKTRAGDEDLAEYLKDWSHRHYLPITFGITAEKHFSSWLGVESGLAYTYLRSEFESGDRNVTCHWHYVELPLKVNLYAYSSDKYSIYGSAGVRVSLPVYSNAHANINAQSSHSRIGSLAPKPVWSAGVSVGVSYSLSKRLDLFVEPSLQYHFPQEAKVPNIWTDDEPWSFSIPLGIRFSW